MDFKTKNFYNQFRWIANLYSRNLRLFLSYSKVRLIILVLLMVAMIIVLKRPDIDGISSIAYGLPIEDEHKKFPLTWFILVIFPILTVGDSSNKILKSDFKAISLINYYLNIIMNSFSLFTYLVFSFTVLVLSNKMIITNGYYLCYIFFFEMFLIIMFQLISTFILKPFLTIVLIAFIIIVDAFIPLSTTINETMLCRFSNNYLYESMFNLIMLLVIVIFITYFKLKYTDFIKGDI